MTLKNNFLNVFSGISFSFIMICKHFLFILVSLLSFVCFWSKAYWEIYDWMIEEIDGED